MAFFKLISLSDRSPCGWLKPALCGIESGVIQRLAISGYRSLRDITLPLGQLTVITGANGSGKSSVYRALRLLADVAQGRVVSSLAAEGGFESTLWAGPEKFSRDMKLGLQPVQGTRRAGPISLRLGFSGDDYGYAIDLGLPTPSLSLFSHDAEIKTETIWTPPGWSRRSPGSPIASPSI